ncbi:MAG: hypothetical protein GY863_21245 [bacterium]|nr:hypothetical protein [bacterium]
MRSLVFVRKFGSDVISNMDIRVRSKSGNIEYTGIDAELSPRKIRFNSNKATVKYQRSRRPQDRLIDIFA